MNRPRLNSCPLPFQGYVFKIHPVAGEKSGIKWPIGKGISLITDAKSPKKPRRKQPIITRHQASIIHHKNDSSALNELIGRRIRSLVTAKVGVVKELIPGGHIPVMVIVKFDGDEFTIPTSPEKLLFYEGQPFPTFEPASTESTDWPEPDWSTYPHLTSSDRLKAELPYSQRVTIKPGGYMALMEQNQQFAEALSTFCAGCL